MTPGYLLVNVWHEDPEITRSHLLQFVATPGWVGLGTDGEARGDLEKAETEAWNYIGILHVVVLVVLLGGDVAGVVLNPSTPVQTCIDMCIRITAPLPKLQGPTYIIVRP